MAFPKPADLDEMKNDPELTVLQTEGLNVGYIAFNTEKKPFDNKLVRQALNLATNKDAILKAVYLGNGQAAKNPIPPILWSYNNAIQDYPYDPAKAKQLLAQAGFPNGFEVDLWYLPVTRPYNPDGKRMAEMIQADWAKVGVKATLIDVRVGRVSQARQERRAPGGDVRLVGRQRRPRQFLRSAAGLRGGEGRRQHRALVQQVASRTWSSRRRKRRSRPIAPSSTSRRRSSSTKRRRGSRWRTRFASSPAQGSQRLQDGRDGASLFRHRRRREAAGTLRVPRGFLLQRH